MSDLLRRSEGRRTQVVIRMSHREREALHRAAEARGSTITGLMREHVTALIKGD